ncbi:hypothetical protein RRG08_052336 [Elysia crispata]|uniref:WAP domain-containing protein n=1 Tax=Elysia crispata TaxID=231223 RepID=A0AAE0ZA55_9GAST|nr:hypothetical protein RRG08_052336 [Elysia crispata]
MHCKLEVICLDHPLKDSHTGVCSVGDPILSLYSRGLRDLMCSPSSPCPIGAYCNTELKDIYSTCCMSDPEAPVKPWTCPANTFTGDDFCLDTCMNDGDCRFNQKCCEQGCKRDCVHEPDICDRISIVRHCVRSPASMEMSLTQTDVQHAAAKKAHQYRNKCPRHFST